MKTRRSSLSFLAFAGLGALVFLLSACAEPERVSVPLGSEQLAALYWEPPENLAPALLLLPMQGKGVEPWTPLARRLHEEGYAVLALEFRERGRTDRDMLLADVRAAFRFLRDREKVDAARIGLIGADVGANAALDFAAREPLVPVVVLLSPGRNYRGVATLPALRDYGVRPLLLLAAEQDPGSAGAVGALKKAAQGDVAAKLYPGDAHGTDLLAGGAPVVSDVLTFLRGRLGVR